MKEIIRQNLSRFMILNVSEYMKDTPSYEPNKSELCKKILNIRRTFYEQLYF